MAGKGFDAKAFLVNHTEKLVLGAAGVMVLAFIGGAQWKPYSGTPPEITDKVVAAEQALKNHGWPEEDRLKYEMTQAKTPKQRVHDFLLSPIPIAPFEMSTRFVSTPWQGKEPLREPAMLKLEDALADAGKVLIERPIDPSKITDASDGESDDSSRGNRGRRNRNAAEPVDNENAAPTEEDDEFSNGQSATLGGDGGEGSFPGGIPAGLGGPAGLKGGAGAALPGGAGAALPGMMSSRGGLSALSSMSGEGGMGQFGYSGSGSGAASQTRDGQGYKFVSVRAVFPLKAQIHKFQEATHAKTMDIAAESFEVLDFKLERQEELAGQDQWSEWEAVDTQSAIDVLNQSAGVEPDIVSGTVTNNVMTMPLPPRIYGSWRKYASHPRIDKFVLSEEEIQQEVEYQSKLLELRKDGQKVEERPKAQKGGFSSVVQDARSVQSQVFGGAAYGSMGMGGMGMGGAMGMGMGRGAAGGGGARDSRMMSSGMNSNMGRMSPGAPGGMNSAMGMGMNGYGRGGAASPQADEAMKKLLETDDKDARGKALREYIQKRVTADGELLLFRYLDFDVDAGKTYRYRVRLILSNPNFGHLASEANGEASVVSGESRPTDWSNVTKPVTVERDVYYFVKDVDTRRGKTRLAVFEWDSKLGTTVAGELDLYPGQHIAGTTKTNVIDPAKSTFEEKDYTFKSSDVFVDTHADVALDRNLHKDLKLPGGSNGEALLPEEVLVVQSMAGELAVIDPVRQAVEQARLDDQQKRQDKSFEALKGAAEGMGGAALGGSGGLMSGDMAEMYGMQSGNMGGKGGGRSVNPMGMMGGRGAGGGMRSDSMMGGPPGARGKGKSGGNAKGNR